MHELSLLEGLRDILEEAALRESFAKVRGVVLEIGALAAVEPDSLRFCFEVVMKGSRAEGAWLQIEILPGRGDCRACGAEVPLATLHDPCPRCGAWRVAAREGTGMRVRELEVD